MSWLVAQERVLASAEIADSFGARLRGVLGRSALEGVLVLDPAKSVHTIGVRFPLDVAFCRRTNDGDLRVIDIVTMAPNRMGLPRISSHVVVEAAKGSFERWGVEEGDILVIRG
ncbi:MAG: DUF192 domain-containing protein [Actinomycetota bacterium]